MAIHAVRRPTPPPFFQSLLSHRYGWRATPSVISKEDFPLLASCLASDDRQAHQLLLQWYTLDENRMPPAYVYNWNALRTARLVCVCMCVCVCVHE